MAFSDTYRLSSHAVITNDQGKVLLLKADYGQKSWGLPGGALDQGETIHQALVRECKEELNCDIQIGYLSGVYYHTAFNSHAFIFRAYLPENAEIMQKHPDIRIEIQGHADERGTTEYNIALGQRRAKAVSDYFVAQGIAPSRLKIVSYGEEKPLTAEQNEMAYSKNRRCEFVIIWGGEAEVKGSDESE